MQHPSLYNKTTAASPSVLHYFFHLSSTLETCPFDAVNETHTDVRHHIASADVTVPLTIGNDPAVMATNGAGHQEAEWKLRDMEGEMRTLCVALKEKVDKFLDTETSDKTLLDTQKQVRVAKQVIDDALKQYKYGLPGSDPRPSLLRQSLCGCRKQTHCSKELS